MTGLFDRVANAFLAPPASEADGQDRHDGPPSGAAAVTNVPAHGEASASAAVVRAGARADGGRRTSARGATRARAVPATAALLCRPDEAAVLGGAAALVLAARCRAPEAVVAVWGAGVSGVRAPATARARRLAERLSARGHDAVATGRLAVVRLEGELATAAPEAVRVLAAASEVPAAVVLAGARTGAADSLLRAQDSVLVARSPGNGTDASSVADLTLAGLTPLGADPRVLDVPSATGPVRALAASGVAVMPPLRGAVEAALGGRT